MPEPIVNPTDLIQAVRSGEKSEINASLSSVLGLEDDIMSGVSFIMSGSEFYDRLIGVQVLATYFRNHGDLISAIPLAQAAFEALENDENVLSCLRPDMNHMAANLLDMLTSGLIETGYIQRLVQDADRWAEWLIRINRVEYYLPQLRLNQVGALILKGDFDLAKEKLMQIQSLTLDSSQIVFLKRLLAKMPVLVRAADEQEPPLPNVEEAIESTLDFLRTAGNQPNIDSFPDLLEMANAIGYSRSPANVDEFIQKASRLDEARHPNGASMSLIDGAADIFQDQQMGYDKEVLAKTIAPLEWIINYAQRMGFWEHQMNASWLWAIAFKRSNRYTEAANALRQLRAEVDKKRLIIADPRNRAGISVYIKHLYTVSAEVLYQLGDAYNEELFDVIEIAKSKILSELTKTHISADNQPEVKIMDGLRELLSRSPSKAIYITFLMDVDVTYAITVDDSGDLRQFKIEIGKTIFDGVAQRLSESCNGSVRNLALSRAIDPNNPWERLFKPILEPLSPLMEWIRKLLDSHQVDVLCVSPDGSMFNIPFHILDIGGEALMSKVGISIVPSAEVLLHSASQTAKTRAFEDAVAFLVPSDHPRNSASKEDIAFNKLVNMLETRIPTKVIKGENADLNKLKTERLTNKLVLLNCDKIMSS